MRFSPLGLLAGLLFACSLPGTLHADDWPQWLGSRRDGVWREKGILEKFPSGGPKILWRKAVGAGYAGPAVADGRVFLTDRVLDPGQKDPANPFLKANSSGRERVLCLDERTGKLLWKHEYSCRYTMSYPSGPRATPVVRGGRVCTLGAMGNLLCLDAQSGKVLWSHDLVKEYDAPVPLWGFAAHPLLDGDHLICLVGRKPAVVSFDAQTGKERWRALELNAAEIGYCPPMIYTFGGKRQLIVWTPESVNGLDPKTGKPLWSYEWNIKANLTISTPRQAGDRLFLTAFYDGARLLEVTRGNRPGVKELWRSHGRGEHPKQTDKLHSIMATPFIVGDFIYGIDSYGELRGLRLADGKRVWTDLTATGTGGKTERWANAFLVEQGDRFFLFNEKGDLVIARLTPKGYEEIDRRHVLDPTAPLAGPVTDGRKVVWSHPAFANRTMFARNDRELIAVSLAAE